MMKSRTPAFIDKNRCLLHRALARTVVVLLVGSLALAVVLAIWWARTSSVAEASVSSDRVVTVGLGVVERSVESSGSVAANLEVEIKCRASGEVIELPYDVSDLVEQGALLCQLDPTDEQLTVQSNQASLAQAQAQLAQAKVAVQQAKLELETSRERAESSLESARVQLNVSQAKLKRMRSMVDENLASAEELEALEAEVALDGADWASANVSVKEVQQLEVALEGKRQDIAIAQAQVEAGQLNLDTAQRQLAYTTVSAPVTGYVSSLDVQKGSIVASGTNNVSGGTTIMTLMDLSRIFILATVDESDIGGVEVGQSARVSVDSFAGRSFLGEVVRIAVEGVEESNVVTFEVKVEITDPDKHLLKPLMTGNITLVQDRRQDVVTVPLDAISRRGTQVLVTMEDGSERPVQIGLEGLDSVEVTSGLSEGDRVRLKDAAGESRWNSSQQRMRPPGMM